MYDWLEKEIAEIKWKKFHVVERHSDQNQVEQSNELDSRLPPSYMTFIREFGKAQLYRESRNTYQLGVFAPPQRMEAKDGEKLLYFGDNDDASAYFKRDLLTPGKESPVFEFEEGQLEKVAGSFDKWLAKAARRIRRSYKKREWQEILNGARPFSEKEQTIIDARRQFKWQVLGFTENGNIRILIKNDSMMTLPYFSVGVKVKSGAILGGLWLPVSDIAPGQEKVVEHSYYTGSLGPDVSEVCDLPDPEPEEREAYWEFRPQP